MAETKDGIASPETEIPNNEVASEQSSDEQKEAQINKLDITIAKLTGLIDSELIPKGEKRLLELLDAVKKLRDAVSEASPDLERFQKLTALVRSRQEEYLEMVAEFKAGAETDPRSSAKESTDAARDALGRAAGLPDTDAWGMQIPTPPITPPVARTASPPPPPKRSSAPPSATPARRVAKPSQPLASDEIAPIVPAARPTIDARPPAAEGTAIAKTHMRTGGAAELPPFVEPVDLVTPDQIVAGQATLSENAEVLAIRMDRLFSPTIELSEVEDILKAIKNLAFKDFDRGPLVAVVEKARELELSMDDRVRKVAKAVGSNAEAELVQFDFTLLDAIQNSWNGASIAQIWVKPYNEYIQIRDTLSPEAQEILYRLNEKIYRQEEILANRPVVDAADILVTPPAVDAADILVSSIEKDEKANEKEKQPVVDEYKSYEKIGLFGAIKKRGLAVLAALGIAGGGYYVGTKTEGEGAAAYRTIEAPLKLSDFPSPVDRYQKALIATYETTPEQFAKENYLKSARESIPQFEKNLRTARAEVLADEDRESNFAQFVQKNTATVVASLSEFKDDAKVFAPAVLAVAFAENRPVPQVVAEFVPQFKEKNDPGLAIIATRAGGEYQKIAGAIGQRANNVVVFEEAIRSPKGTKELGKRISELPYVRLAAQAIGMTLPRSITTGTSSAAIGGEALASPIGGVIVTRTETATGAGSRLQESLVRTEELPKQTADTRVLAMLGAEGGQELTRGSVASWANAFDTRLQTISTAGVGDIPAAERALSGLAVSYIRTFSKTVGYDASEPRTFTPYTPDEFQVFAHAGEALIKKNAEIVALNGEGMPIQIIGEVQRLVVGAKKNTVEMGWELARKQIEKKKKTKEAEKPRVTVRRTPPKKP